MEGIMENFSSAIPIVDVIRSHKKGKPIGIFSVCSANESVISATLKESKRNDNHFVLIEATCNQVNQFGGYTGMTPFDFADYIREIAYRMDFPLNRIILGGDHLGINPWQSEPIDSALHKACDMITSFVNAGFAKIHIDMSMPSLSDVDLPLTSTLIAERSAILCEAAENASAITDGIRPFYVIGSEVPPPGGSKSNEQTLEITQPKNVRETLEIFEEVFTKMGLHDAFSRTIALVVQPGVEFGDHEIHDYNHENARKLSEAILEFSDIIYEAHSTDYQTVESLRSMVKDHFAILKVGPELTFAYREAIFALAAMEEEWVGKRYGSETSHVLDIIDQVMLENPYYWIKFYGQDSAQQAFSRKYSLSDRIRYYWNEPHVSAAVLKLIDNLIRYPLPYSLISQFMPAEAQLIREKKITNSPQDLVESHIGTVIRKYQQSCWGDE